MDCFCEEKKTFNVKVEGDLGADPIWCDLCYSNLDIEDAPLSKSLRAELMRWAWKYGEWMDWEKEVLDPDGLQMKEKHNALGKLLSERVQEELGDKYKVRFSPSPLVEMYGEK